MLKAHNNDIRNNIFDVMFFEYSNLSTKNVKKSVFNGKHKFLKNQKIKWFNKQITILKS